MKGAGTGNLLAESGDNGCFHTGTDQDLRSVYLLLHCKHLADGFHTGQCISGSAAGENRIDSQTCRIPVGLKGVTGNIDAPVQGQAGALCSCQKEFHGMHIQIAICV